MRETQAREMLDPARGDDQAIHAPCIEHEAQGGLRHRHLQGVSRIPQPLDRGERFLIQMAAEDLRCMSEAAARRRVLAEPVFAGE